METGLKFTPTPRSKNITEIKTDILEFCRRLRLTECFSEITRGISDHSLVKNKSNFTPSKQRNKALDTFCETILKFQIEASENKKIKLNFTKSQWESLEELSKDDSIIIKEADKGSTVVVMDKQDYKEMVLNILKDKTFYSLESNYKQYKILAELQKLVEQFRNSFTDKEREYITKFQCKTSNFYGLPKIHKSKAI